MNKRSWAAVAVLAVVQQNDRSALEAGARVQLAWREEDAFQLPTVQQNDRRDR